eukprot:15133093-Alexandrium_andersonii.AAC.1
MSASLVGSEMCIRDSACSVSRVPSSRSLLIVAGATKPGAGVGNCWRAVSYTHLTLPTICSV